MLPKTSEVELVGQTVIARLGLEELTHLEMQEIVEECLTQMRCHNASHVILDMQGVEFLASTCIGSMVSLLQDLQHVRGKLALINCCDEVTFLFKVTRLDAVIEIYDDEKEALDNL